MLHFAEIKDKNNAPKLIWKRIFIKNIYLEPSFYQLLFYDFKNKMHENHSCFSNVYFASLLE